MRITSAGSLLVAKTALNVEVAGHELRSDGYSAATRAGATVGSYTRLTDSGRILEFREGTVTVGSWLSRASTVTSIVMDHRENNDGFGIGTTNSSSLVPTINTGALVDGTKDLGEGATRWRNLYLSAGAYASFIAGQGDSNTSINFPGSDVITFNNGGSEAMRIDSSGNLLVGKTTSSSATGHELLGYGRSIHTANSTTVQIVNRLGNDGDISIFQKDGTTVGSIGSYVDLPYIGKSDVNLMFDPAGPHIIPRGTNGGARDAAINLGSASNRFKDLYLSGGVYLGGTGAANKLDDYEEGTWTATPSEGSLTEQEASKYVKIGQNVTIFFDLRAFTDNTSSGSISISGLPYACTSRSANGIMHRYWDTDGEGIVAYVSSGTQNLEFISNGTSNWDSVKYSDNNSVAISIFSGSLTYRAS